MITRNAEAGGKKERQQLLDALSAGVLDGDEGKTSRAAGEWVRERWPAAEGLSGGLVAGMRVVAERFGKREWFLPQALLSLAAFYSGLDGLRPSVPTPPDGESSRRIYIGSVNGDSHALGETLVETVALLSGFSVIRWPEGRAAERLNEAGTAQGLEVFGVFPVEASSRDPLLDVLRRLGAHVPSPSVLIGSSQTSCETAAALVDGVCSCNAREAFAQAMHLACLLPQVRSAG